MIVIRTALEKIFFSEEKIRKEKDLLLKKKKTKRVYNEFFKYTANQSRI